MEREKLKSYADDFNTYTDERKVDIFKSLYEKINREKILIFHAFFIAIGNYRIFRKFTENRLDLLKNIENKIISLSPYKHMKIFILNNIVTEEENSGSDIYAKLSELLKRKLLENKMSVFHESYNRYFNIVRENQLNVQQLIFDNIEIIKPKNIVYLIQEEHITEEFLTQLYEYPDFTKALFLSLYIENEEVYNQIVYKIFYENYFITPLLMESLVNLSFETMPLYNYEILSFFIKKREFLYEKIVEKCRVIDKPLLLSLIISHHDFFIKYIESFPLQFNDIIYVASKEPLYLYYLYDSRRHGINFNYNSFCKSLSMNEGSFISDFFAFIVNRNNFTTHEHNEKIISTFINYYSITDDLIKLFSENYLESREYFCAIIKILPKDIIYEYLNKYLIDDHMVNVFCQALTPNEILYRAHQFTPTKRAVEATKLCFDNLEIFTEDILAQTLGLLENDNNTFFMRTVCFSLIKFPNLRNYIIQMLKQIKLIFWTKKDNVEGFIKACEILEADCLKILNELDFKILDKIFSMSPSLQKNARVYVQYNITPYYHLKKYFY